MYHGNPWNPAYLALQGGILIIFHDILHRNYGYSSDYVAITFAKAEGRLHLHTTYSYRQSGEAQPISTTHKQARTVTDDHPRSTKVPQGTKYHRNRSSSTLPKAAPRASILTIHGTRSFFHFLKDRSTPSTAPSADPSPSCLLPPKFSLPYPPPPTSPSLSNP